MTSYRYVTLVCDSRRCDASFGGPLFRDRPPSEVRREAKELGWYSRRVRSGGPNEHYTIDLCPKHAATGGES